MVKDKNAYEIKPELTDDWLSDIKQESIDKALELGIIFPSFKPYKNTVYTVRMLSKPRLVDNEKGKFFVMDIERDGMRFSMNLNNSFRFQLATLLKRHNLVIDQAIGSFILISKDDKGFFSVQLKD